MKNMLLVVMLTASTAAGQEFASDAPAVSDILARTRALQASSSASRTAARLWQDIEKTKENIRKYADDPLRAGIYTAELGLLQARLAQPAPSSPEALAASARPAASAQENANEFSRVPAWLDASRLKFEALMKASGGGGIAVLRYGWRGQYEMSVFAFAGSPSVSFREYSADPMGRPTRSLDATLETAPARRAAAAMLRAAQERHPVSGKDKAALDDVLAFLDAEITPL